MIQPRQYQIEAQAAIQDEWDKGNKRTLIVLPTGTGKTIVFCYLAEDVVRQGGRVLILAHRGELLEQAADKMQRTTGLGCSVEKAEQTCFDDWNRITVGSVQSLMRPKRLAKFAPDYYTHIIIDEAHHALAESYQRVLAHFQDALVLGVTATPDRGDMRELGQYFNSLAYEYSLPRAIKDGFLCRIKAQTIPLEIDLSQVVMQAGDYQLSDLDATIEPYLQAIVDEMQGLCHGRKTVVFLPLIKTSKMMCRLLEQAGFRAAEVNGESKDRKEILQAFDRGDYDVLCNSMLLTEGWDCPSVDCIVCLRPTKIRSLYCQIIGRGTRIHPGKDHLLLLDFLWLTNRHELCRPAHLIAESPEIAKAMTDKLNATGELYELEELMELSEEDAMHEREIALAKRLEEVKKRKRALVDPLQYEMSIADLDLVNYKPTFAWETEAPSTEILKKIEKAGLFPDEIKTNGEAIRICQAVDQRRAAGLATPKQIRFLEGRGFQHVGTWPFDAATRMINRIAANGWRTPCGINPATYQPAITQWRGEAGHGRARNTAR